MIAQVKEEVLLRIRLQSEINPIVGTAIQQEITGNLVELPPARCQFAKPALAQVPTFVIRRTEAVSPTIFKTQNAHVLVIKASKLERVHIKGEKDVATSYSNC